MNTCPEPTKSMKRYAPPASLAGSWTESEGLGDLFDQLGWAGIERLHVSSTACLPSEMLLEGAWADRIRRFSLDDLDSVALSAASDEAIWFDPVSYGTFRQACSATILSSLSRARLIADLTATGVLPTQMPFWLDAAAISAADRVDDWRYLALTTKTSAVPPLTGQRGRVAANIARWMRRSLAVESVLYPEAAGGHASLWRAIAVHATQPVRLSLVLKDLCPVLTEADFGANQALLLRPAGKDQRSSVELIPMADGSAQPLLHLHIGDEDEDVIWDDIDRVFYGLELQCNAHKSKSGRDLHADQAQ